MNNNTKDFAKIKEDLKQEETAVFDIANFEIPKTFEEMNVEELQYELNYLNHDRKTKEKIKKLIKEKSNNNVH